MNVGTADAGAEDPDQNVINAEGRLGDIFEPQSRLGVRFDECFQGISRLLW